MSLQFYLFYQLYFFKMRVENLITNKIKERNLPFLVSFQILRIAKRFRVEVIYNAIVDCMSLEKIIIICNKLWREK